MLTTFDDNLMEKVLGDEDVLAEDIRRALRRGTLENHCVPILNGSAFKNKGVQPMLDAVVDFLPSPVDLPPTQGTKPGKDEVLERKPDDAEPFSALAFKIMTDPYVGKLTYLRVYSGTLGKGRHRHQHDQGHEARAPRATPPHAREQPRRLRHHPHRRHRRGRRSQAGHDR